MRSVFVLAVLTTACSTGFDAEPSSPAAAFEADASGNLQPSPDAEDAPAPFMMRGSVVQNQRMAVSTGDAPDGGGCLDDTNGGVSGSMSPESVEVVFKRITLLGEDGTADVDLLVEDDPSTAVVHVLGADPVDLGLAQPGEGTYWGMEIEIWSIGVPLPISHDAFPDADPVVRGWLGSTGAISQRDLTFVVEEDNADYDAGDYWMGSDTGALSPVADAVAGDDGTVDTGSEPTVPAHRLRMQNDTEFFTEDPVVMETAADQFFSWSMPDEGLVVTADYPQTVEMTFDTTDLFRWWEALEGDDPATADGTYTFREDCGFHLDMPLIHASPSN